MTGFKVPRKTARLQFEGDDFNDCEIVVALGLTVGAAQHMRALQAAARGDEDEEDGQRTVALLDFFAENCIDSWNLEDEDGNPIPITSEAFRELPDWFGGLILSQWTAAAKEAGEVDAPLDDASPNGRSSPEQSERTAAASSVPQS